MAAMTPPTALLSSRFTLPPVTQEGDLTIRRAQAGELAVLEPLWKSLQEHHAQITPRLGPSPKRDAEASWQRRLAKYELWAKNPDTFVILAERDERAIGYAFVTVRAGHASWASGDRIAELETLVVLKRERGRGVGTALVRTVKTHLAELEIDEVMVTAAVTNYGAHRFYERHGLVHAFHVFYGRLGDRR